MKSALTTMLSMLAVLLGACEPINDSEQINEFEF